MFPPFLISLVVTLVIVGIVLAILNAAPMIDPAMKAWIRLLILGLTAIWLIYFLVGVLGGSYYPYPYPYPPHR